MDEKTTLGVVWSNFRNKSHFRNGNSFVYLNVFREGNPETPNSQCIDRILFEREKSQDTKPRELEIFFFESTCNVRAISKFYAIISLQCRDIEASQKRIT